MKKNIIPCMLMLALALPLAAGISWATKAAPETPAPEETTPAELQTYNLCDLDLTKITCGDSKKATKNKTVEDKALTMFTTVYENGVGVHAESKAIVKLNGAAEFHALVGIDDEAAQKDDNHCNADYAVIGVAEDKTTETTLASGTINRKDGAPKAVDIEDLSAYTYLILNITKGSDNQIWADHVDWANAIFKSDATNEAPVTLTEAEFAREGVEAVAPPTAPTKPDMHEMDLLTELGGFDNITTGWANHPAQVDASINGTPLTLKGVVYASGVGTHATSQIVVQLNGASWFVATLGIDDEVKGLAGGDCSYSVIGKGGGKPETTLANGTIKSTDAEPVKIDVQCEGYKYLVLTADDNGGNQNDHVDWVNAWFERSGNNDVAPVIVSPDVFNTNLLCATQMFSQPGVRFMHKLRCGNPDATISVKDLPEGLTYNAKRQLVEGIVETEGDYTYIVSILNDEGDEPVEETISLTVSSQLQQPTPFMGWLSWNALEGNVSEDKVIDAAKAFVDLGLKDAGYNYICMDDKWHASGREEGTNKPLADANKFPNGMKNLTDKVHEMGMKIGIYSDAAASTCGGMFGSFGYETIDANQYAEWGFDLLKYDACGAPSDVAGTSARYKAMGDALKASGRDILFYICEWGQREPWKWGPDAGGTCWRISYDTRDIWDHGAHNGGQCGAIQVIDIMKNIGYYAGVNRFNDGDMMMIGLWGTGKSSSNAGAKGMTATEYQSQFSMWCMFASPLTISNDPRFWNNPSALANSGINAEGQKRIRDNKENDLNILKNEEMIAIDQDRMGQSALLMQTLNNGDIEIYMKDLENGDIALAVLNRGTAAHDVTLNLADYYLKENQDYAVRDLWAHAYTDTTKTSFDTNVASHETKVFRISKYVDPNVGISSTQANADVRVVAQPGQVQVTAPGTQGQSKRILVSTLAGQVVASATSGAETVSIPVRAPKGVYVVNTVCNGRASSTKVKL